MRYIMLTLVLSILAVILAPYFQRLYDWAKTQVMTGYNSYKEEGEKHE